MRNACKFAVLAVMLFLVQFSFADTIPTEGQWNEEDYYRSVHTNRPPVASIEGDILSLSFEDALSNLTVCVMNDEGVKVYEDVVSSEAGGTYSFFLQNLLIFYSKVKLPVKCPNRCNNTT